MTYQTWLLKRKVAGLFAMQELAKDFGYFQMDWRDLAVPKRGGVVLESFNSDEVVDHALFHTSSLRTFP